MHELIAVVNFLPGQNMPLRRTDNAQLAVGHCACGEAVGRGEIFGEQHFAVGGCHANVVVDTNLLATVNLAVVLSHTHTAIFEVARALVDQHVVDIGLRL